MIVDIPNWPLYSIEIFTVRIIITNWVLSFFKIRRQSLGIVIGRETLFLDL